MVSNGEQDLIDSPLADAFYRPLAEIPDETESETISGNTTPEDSPMVEYALAHARRGLRVFPVYQVHDGSCICYKAEVCESPAKHPRIKGWQNLATTDESQIRDWWKKWRNANIGIVTDDLLVLDVDPKNGGDVSLTELIEECGVLPSTLTAITGSNGRHLLFSRPADIKIRNLQNSVKLGEGLDIRADGGFIVAVGSKHISGKRYRWIDESAAIEAAPSWLLERLTAPPAAPSEPVIQREVSSGGTKHRRSAGAVWSAPVAEGARNSTLFRWASGLRGGGKSRDEILDSLRWRNSQCLPPLADVELVKIADSVASYPTNAAKFGH